MIPDFYQYIISFPVRYSLPNTSDVYIIYPACCFWRDHFNLVFSSSLSPRPFIPDSLIITRKFYHLYRMRDSESVKYKVKASCCFQGSYVGPFHLQDLSCERPQISTNGVYTSNFSWQFGKNSSVCSTMLILTAIGICQLHRI